MRIKLSQLRKIIQEEVNRSTIILEDQPSRAGSWSGQQKETPAQLDSLKAKATKIEPRKLKPSEEAIRLIKKHEGFRKRVYDDKIDTEEATGPWIVSFGYDPITGVPIGPDPLSGRLGGKKFDITNFSDTQRMSKTRGVPTVGYGFALNTADKLRKWSKHLGGAGPYSEPQFGLGGNPFGSQDIIPEELILRRDMSEAEADRTLREMLPEYYIPIRRSLEVPITQDQFDALVSRAWNEGAAGKTILAAVDLLNADFGLSWLEAGKAGRFNEDGSRQRAERNKMLSWRTA